VTSGTVERVVRFLSRELHVKELELKPETRLKQDLRLDGADAVELLEKFAKQFGVDMSACQLTRHFGPESSDPLRWLWFVISRKRWVPITVADLVRSAQNRRWTCAGEGSEG
jgi:acyl carrier protein